MRRAIALALFLSGCTGIKTTIKFTKQDSATNPVQAVSGVVEGNFKNVQEFRSALEALEYRLSEKAK